jgi:hypothetical protein
VNWLGHAIDGRVLDYVLIFLSVFFSLCLFGTLKLDASRRVRKHARQAADLETQLQRFRERIGQVERQMAEQNEVPTAVPVVSEVAWSGVNLTKRSKALRLHRLGAEANVICRTVGVVQGELSLMIKIQKLIAGSGEVKKQ